MRNPQANRYKELGLTQAEFDLRAAELLAHLKANDDKPEIDEATARAALKVVVSDRVWNAIKKDLGIT